jgi:hypothetical protein
MTVGAIPLLTTFARKILVPFTLPNITLRVYRLAAPV